MCSRPGKRGVKSLALGLAGGRELELHESWSGAAVSPGGARAGGRDRVSLSQHWHGLLSPLISQEPHTALLG